MPDSSVRLFQRFAVRAGVVVLVLLTLVAVTVPLLVNPHEMDMDLLRENHPSLEHPLGTDTLGRDMLALTAAALRSSITLAAFVTAAWVGVVVIAGVGLGLLAGFRLWLSVAGLIVVLASLAGAAVVRADPHEVVAWVLFLAPEVAIATPLTLAAITFVRAAFRRMRSVGGTALRGTRSALGAALPWACTAALLVLYAEPSTDRWVWPLAPIPDPPTLSTAIPLLPRYWWLIAAPVFAEALLLASVVLIAIGTATRPARPQPGQVGDESPPMRD